MSIIASLLALSFAASDSKGFCKPEAFDAEDLGYFVGAYDAVGRDYWTGRPFAGRASRSHCVAYATGGWSASASIKLASAGFPLQGIPLASSDDYPDRESIMVHALNQLRGEFQSVTYYGDGDWDEAASRNLGWKFVPVGARLSGLTRFKPVGA
jgi:hypothetical protein